MDLFKKIIGNKLFQVSFLNNVSMCIRLLTGVVTAKLIAVYVGPGGMALMGNFRNFLTSVESISTLGFQNGIVKYISEYRNDEKKKSQFVAVLVLLVAVFSVLIGVLSYVFRSYLNTYIFDDALSLEFLFVVLAFVFPLQAFNVVFVGIINGLERFKQLMFVNIFGNLLAFGVGAFLMYYWTLNGALLSLIVGPALVGLLSFYWVQKELFLMLQQGIRSWNFSLLKPLFSFSVMAVFSGILGPIVFFYIRNYIIDSQGFAAAGYWEAANRISGFYMMFITTLVAVYFLPKLAATEDRGVIRNELKKYLKWVVPVFALGLIMVYFCRFFFIELLMSKSFLPVADILSAQLIGDFFKAISFIFGILFYAKRIVIAFLVTEALSFLMLFLSSIFLIDQYGIQGATMAHAWTSVFYLLVLLFYFRKKI